MVVTGIILTVIWGSYYLFCRERHALVSSKVMFAILACMVIPCLFNSKFLEFFDITVNLPYTIIFGFFIISGLMPWKIFDRYLYKKKNSYITCSPRNIKKLKKICFVLIVLSLFSIIYLLPYAILGLMLDTVEVRQDLLNGNFLLPNSILTTLSVGFAGLNIYCILFFYLSYCLEQLKRYRILLLISSSSNVVAAATFAGRDQFVVIIIFYIVFYFIFRPFFNEIIQKKIKRFIVITMVIVGAILSTLTLSRFWSAGRNDDSINFLLVGTLGYIAEQPLVFNSYIEKEKEFTGIKKSFPLIDYFLDLPSKERRSREGYRQQFGTMYASFYSMFGWSSMIFGAAIFFLYYYCGMKYLVRRNRFFPLLLFFCVYLYLEITGIFYLKAEGSVMINLFYIVLSIFPFFIGNYVKLRGYDMTTNKCKMNPYRVRSI